MAQTANYIVIMSASKTSSSKIPSSGMISSKLPFSGMFSSGTQSPLGSVIVSSGFMFSVVISREMPSSRSRLPFSGVSSGIPSQGISPLKST